MEHDEDLYQLALVTRMYQTGLGPMPAEVVAAWEDRGGSPDEARDIVDAHLRAQVVRDALGPPPLGMARS